MYIMWVHIRVRYLPVPVPVSGASATRRSGSFQIIVKERNVKSNENQYIVWPGNGKYFCIKYEQD
jgi:hypothetical protein